MLHLAMFVTSLFVQIKIWRNPEDPFLNPTAEYLEKCDKYYI
jgi:hypothetical protein